MQIALARRILVLEGCLERSHFLAPLPRSLERARSRSTGLARAVLHSIYRVIEANIQELLADTGERASWC
jgi:hypothetical protein